MSMQTRRGRIQNGAVVLADPHGVPEGAEVTVLIATAQDVVEVSEEELAVIDAGLAAARRPARIDAREFLRALAQRK
jgi:hypothetical protein